MKNFLKRFSTSRTAAIIMMLLYALLMAAATVIEKYSGTTAARSLVYYSPLFLLLQLLMVVNFIGVSVEYRFFKAGRWGYLMVHGAFIIILAGASVTHFFSKDGMMSIREGTSSDEMVVGTAENYHIEKLPFSLELVDFRLVRYPGSHSPSSYESDLKIHSEGEVLEKQVYMNHVLDFKGYRFFQASYDQDEKGTVLSVSYDTVGRSITYTGYAILLLGLILCMFSKNGRFRMMLRSLDKVAAVVIVLAFSSWQPPHLSAAGLPSEVPSPVRIDPVHASHFAVLPMQSPQGRIIPVNTFALEILHKLKIEELPEGFGPDQFLLSLMADPSRWAAIPLVVIEEKSVRKIMSGGRERISYMDAFDARGNYLFHDLVEAAYVKTPAQRTLSDKEILKVDERINVLHLLFNFRLVKIFPVPGDHKGTWIAAGDEMSGIPYETVMEMGSLLKDYMAAVMVAAGSGRWEMADAGLDRIRLWQKTHCPALDAMDRNLAMEVRYNQMGLLEHSRRIYLIAGGLLFVLSLAMWFTKRKRKLLKAMQYMLAAAVVAGVVLHAWNMGMRWYISGHVPLSNSYETMVLLAWTTVLGGFCFARKSMVAFSLSVLFGGVILFVSELNWMDPQITPLVPVLKSPWLMFHVACMMVSYGFLGIGAVLSIINLAVLACRNGKNRNLLEAQVKRLTVINEMSLYVGLAMMLVGIFLGAVWANESWGTYWSWDPKETWALVTAVIYAALLHWRWFSGKHNDLLFNVFSQWAILAVLMTYFGVNYLLSGMHSYGDTTLFLDFPKWIFGAAALVFLLPGLAAWLREARMRHLPVQ